MPKSNNIPQKEKYRLWWEYLKRSEDFERIEAGLNKPYASRDPNLLAELRSQKGGYLLFRELLFGPQPSSLEAWWDNEFLSNKRKVEDTTNDIEEFSKYFTDLRNDKVDSIYISNFFDKDPDFGDKFDVGYVLLQPLYSDLNISINRIDLWSIAELEKEIRKIISIRKKQKSKMSSNYGHLTEKMRYKEVSNYLNVFDKVKRLKEKTLSWEKITSAFYPELVKRPDDENLSVKAYERIQKRISSHERRLKMEYAKAKKIISNAEKGQFPGKY